MRPGCHRIPGVRDSKTLSAAQRERLAPLIRARAVAVGVGAASVREIDQLNIYHATHLAMRRAIARVRGHDHVLVDGNRIVGFEAHVGPYSNIVDGDAKVYSIACASVVAKVVRDRMMNRLAVRYPGYGWERNQGYATLEHRMAIRELGLTPFHRRSFLALQRTLAGDQLELDLLADPAASAETHELLARELTPVMADDAMLDAADLEVAGARRPRLRYVADKASPATMPPWRTDPTTRGGRRPSRRVMPPRRWSPTVWRTPVGPSWPGTSMSVVTSWISWRSTRVRLPRSWSWRSAGGPIGTSACPRRPSTTASGSGSGRRRTASSTAARFRTERLVPRLPLRFDLVVVEPGGRIRHHRHAL